MPKPNHDLVSIKIKKTSRQQLQVIKAFQLGYPVLGKSDYAMLEALIDAQYAEVMAQLTQAGY